MRNFFVTYKSPITVFIFLILIGGAYAYSNMRSSLFPEITFPKIKVIADAGQQPVDQMMMQVTRPLENAIKQVPDLTDIRSTTSRGSCEISAYIDWNADIDISQQRIESKINEIKNTLPQGIDINVERMNPSILPVMAYTLKSNSKSQVELKLIATYTIKPFLSQVSGVSEIRIIGGKEKEYWLEIDVQKMSTLGITPEMVNQAFQQTNFIQSNGYLSDYRFMYLTLTDTHVSGKEDLENVVLSNNGKRTVTVKDIGVIQIMDAKEYVKINANGEDAILIAVVKQPNTNVLDLASAMESKVNDLQKILPADITLKPYYVQADFVGSSIKSVTDSLWIGLLLAMAVALIFLRSFKSGITLLITIPVTLLLAVIVLFSIGQTLNIMTLGAIAAAIGLIIDDAIVVVEQIHRTHEDHPDETTAVLLQRSIRYLFPGMVGSSLSTIIIFLPFALMTGVAGAYFKVMTDTMIITLVCSFFVTWLCLPVIYIVFTKNVHSNSKMAKVNNSSQELKTGWIHFFIKNAWISFIFIALLIASILYIFPKLETGFLPEMDEGSIVMDYSSPPGTSLEETDRMLREIEILIAKVPEVEDYSRRTGTQMGFFITEPNTGDYLIQLNHNRKRTTDEVTEDIRKRIENTQPSLQIDFGQVIGDMLGDLMASVQPVEIKIFGDDKEMLHVLSKKVASVVENIDGAVDVFDGVVIAGPSVTVLPDLTQLALFGITPADFQFQMQTALEGNELSAVYDKEQMTPIRLVYRGNADLTIHDVYSLQIFLPNGKLKPITSLASITIFKGDAEIDRENLQNMGVVTARLENRDLGSVMRDVQTEVSAQVHLPQGYHIAYGGAYADQQKSFHELLLILITASLLVFCLILFLFREVRIALLILFLAILGISGSYIALFFTHTPLNVGSYTGLIMIVGIIGENAIFTFLQFKQLVKTLPAQQAIERSIAIRLRPNLMTALGAIVALLPIALGVGTGAQLHQPLAIAVIGGFTMAMPILLIVFPSLLQLTYGRESNVSAENINA